ncbi:MAG: CBS domain-containing protein [Planctomycetota bacterium]|jgi:acetoin utilization protein AcuB
MLDIRIGSVMTPAPETVREDAPLEQARKVMYRERIHHLPVTSGNRVTGMLTDRDLNLVAYLANDLLPENEIVAGDAAVPDPFTARPEDPLVRVLDTMARRRIGSALVVDGGKLVGIFTSHDACALLAKQLRVPTTALACTSYAVGPRTHGRMAL